MMPLPQPGELFAWGIVYGQRRQFRLAIPRDEQHDLAYAERRAAELGGVLVPLSVGNFLATEARNTPSSGDPREARSR